MSANFCHLAAPRPAIEFLFWNHGETALLSQILARRLREGHGRFREEFTWNLILASCPGGYGRLQGPSSMYSQVVFSLLILAILCIKYNTYIYIFKFKTLLPNYSETRICISEITISQIRRRNHNIPDPKEFLQINMYILYSQSIYIYNIQSIYLYIYI